MLTRSVLILGILLLYGIFHWLQRYQYRFNSWRKQTPAEGTTSFPRHPPKPAWVKNEILRLKARMPQDGCRTIAHTFNRLYAANRQMTVGKTYVSDTIRKHQYEIQVLRRKLKHRKPRPVPIHRSTDKGCPWMNGRVERFFGTLKAKTRDLLFAGDTLQQELNVFRCWYNQIRPHHYLNGLTPAEAYRGSEQIGSQARKVPVWFEAWAGALTGFYHPP